MQTSHATLQGLWLPLVTPFRDGVLDEASLRRLVRHFATEPVDGLILGATTGEGLTRDEEEAERLVAVSTDELAAIGRCLPLYLGLSGSDTRASWDSVATPCLAGFAGSHDFEPDELSAAPGERGTIVPCLG